KGKGLEILYARDPVDVYFLQVQGSGRAKLPDGTIIGVGYAGKNGHPNTLAGRTLVELEEMALEEVSMQSIRQWFENHPDRIDEILHRDDSYVFFQITGGDGPFGSSGAVLTPEHSLAVDPDFIPMGIPVFAEGEVPIYGGPKQKEFEPFREILIAQDTGGVIRGAIRGDVFWGNGDKAEYMAGHMNNEARFTLLLPKGALGEGE
ncbi:MAG TPA: MltA domain-containing protein, partial [Sphingomonadales bacterium]|nr:MltA domain-containing protein [Sphingomonadales bacterium]